MLISLVSPRHGLGQTTTAINLAVVLSGTFKEKSVIIDTNRYCNDVEFFLSRTRVTKGLDDFFGLYRSGRLNCDSFRYCVKNVLEDLCIMAANTCCEFTPDDIGILVDYAKKSFRNVVIDTPGYQSTITRKLADVSDVVVIVLSQSRNVIEHFFENNLYSNCKAKKIIVINKYMRSFDGRDFSYGLEEIVEYIEDAGASVKVFPLYFDPELKNECDGNSLLNFTLGMHMSRNRYNEELLNIGNFLTGKGEQQEKEKGKENQGKLYDKIKSIVSGAF